MSNAVRQELSSHNGTVWPDVNSFRDSGGSPEHGRLQLIIFFAVHWRFNNAAEQNQTMAEIRELFFIKEHSQTHIARFFENHSALIQSHFYSSAINYQSLIQKVTENNVKYHKITAFYWLKNDTRKICTYSICIW